MRYIETHAKHLVNAMPHSTFSVTKGLSCRLSMNTAFGCEAACSYCYIRYLTRWKGIGPNDIFTTIHIRTNAPTLLRRDLRGKDKEWLWIGSTADPYQRFEEKYRLMRGCLEVLGEYQFPYEIITKGGALITRDIDLLVATRTVGMVSMSLFSSLNEKKRKAIEIKACPTAERLHALSVLNAAGINTMALLLPILPFYADDLSEIRELLTAVRAAGTRRLYAGVMRLYPITWAGMQRLMPARLDSLRDHYREVYFGTHPCTSAGARVPGRGYRRGLMEAISQMARDLGFVQFLCEDNFFDLWFGEQDEHQGFRYAMHYDFYRERLLNNNAPLTLAQALAVAQRFRHTPSFLRSIGSNLDLLNRLTDAALVAKCGCEP
jgi:DNA repair photolyase